jgi:hypothetical protein
MHPSNHVHRSHRPAAVRVAVAIVGGALLCTAATGPALASARHSHSPNSHSPNSHSHSSRSHKPAAHKPAVHKPAAHKPAKPSAPSSVSGGWSYYTVRTAKSSKTPLLYGLAVKRVSNSDLSLEVFRLGSGGPAPQGNDVVQPGWILVLPASGSTPTGPAAHMSAQPPVSGGWTGSYTVSTAQGGGSQVLYELAVKQTSNGDLSLNVFQFGGGSSPLEGSGVIRPGWVLVLPANGSAPAAPTGPLAEAGASPMTGQGTHSASPAASGQGTAGGTRHGGAQHSGTQHIGTQHIGTQHDGAEQKLTSAAAPTSARLTQAGEIGATVLIVLLLAIGLILKRRRGHQRAGRPDRRDSPRLSPRPARRGRAGGKRGSTVPAPSSPALASDQQWAVGDTSPAPALLMAVPVPALSGGVAPALSGGSAAAGGSVTPGGGLVPPRAAVLEPAAARAVGLDDSPWPDYLVPAGPGPVADAARDETPSVGAQRHRVVSGDDQIEVVLAQAPAAGQRGGSAWLARSPYLVWTPLPYDIPEDGVAFACLGTGDEGCLFIDLAAAPGVISIGGDRAAAARLAESIAHQMSMAGDDGHHLAVTVVGDAVPGPLPAGITGVATVSSLGSAGPRPASPGDATGIVFCAPRSDEETFALARYTATAQHRVIPVVLADVTDAPWSFTAHPSPPQRLVA